MAICPIIVHFITKSARYSKLAEKKNLGPYPAVFTLRMVIIPYALKMLFPAANQKTCL